MHLFTILALTLTGVGLRFWWIANVPNTPISDFGVYHEMARNVFLHNGYSYQDIPMAYQGPGYSYALGLFYRVVGNADVFTGMVFNAILSSLTLVALYFVFKKLLKKKAQVCVAYGLAAVLPNFVAYTNVLGSEVLAAFLLVLLVAVQVSGLPRPAKGTLLGVLVGLSTLVKPIFLVYPVVLALGFWLKSKSWRETLTMACTLSLVAGMTILPWTLRNYRVYGEIIPVAFNSGTVLYLNNNENNHTGSWMPMAAVIPSDTLVQELASYGFHYGESAKEQSRALFRVPQIQGVLKSAAKDWIRQNPLEFLKLGLIRLENVFFSGAPDIPMWSMKHVFEGAAFQEQPDLRRSIEVFTSVANILMHMLSLSGLLFLIVHAGVLIRSLWSRWVVLDEAIIVPSLNLLFFASVYFVFEGQARYNFPVLFLLIACAVWCLSILWQSTRYIEREGPAETVRVN